MISLTLSGLLVWGGTAVLMAAAYVSVRNGTLHPATVDPFLAVPPGVSSADTLANYSALTQTPPPIPAAAEWQLRTVGSLTDAEDLLDLLENRHVCDREVLTISNTCFAVRWR